MPNPETTRMPKLAEIAKRIHEHLHRIEWADPNRGNARGSFWCSGAYESGSRVAVWYVSYQARSHLTKADAWRYLQWLDAGNNGRHYEAFRDAA